MIKKIYLKKLTIVKRFLRCRLRRAWTALLGVLLVGYPLLGMSQEAVQLDLAMSEPVVLANQAPSQTARNYVQLTLQGTAALSRKQALQRNIVIVLDIATGGGEVAESNQANSQSLKNHVERALLQVSKLLELGDSLSVVAHNGVLHDVLPAKRLLSTDDQEVMQTNLKQQLEHWQPTNKTALFAALSKGLRQAQQHAGGQVLTKIIVLSNSPEPTGVRTVQPYAQLADSAALEGVSISTIGMGLQHREDILNALARQSDGYYWFLENSADLTTALVREIDDMQLVVAQDLELTLRCAPGVELLQVLGREADIVGQAVHIHMAQLSAGQKAVVLFELALPVHDDSTQITVATADIAYQQPHQQQFYLSTQQVDINYTDKRFAVAVNRNPQVLGNVSKLLYSDLTKEAIRLQDAGQTQQAEQTLQQAEALLRRAAQAYEQDELRDLVELNDVQSQQLKDETTSKNLQRQRKQLTEQQFNLDTQQELKRGVTQPKSQPQSKEATK